MQDLYYCFFDGTSFIVLDQYDYDQYNDHIEDLTKHTQIDDAFLKADHENQFV